MKPRRTHDSTAVFHSPGGNEDNDLWVQRGEVEGTETVSSVWEPTPEERARIAAGENIELVVYGGGQPPVRLAVTDVPLGKGCAHEWQEIENAGGHRVIVCRLCRAGRAAS